MQVRFWDSKTKTGPADAVSVKWESGPTNVYRWGAEDSYDVELFDKPVVRQHGQSGGPGVTSGVQDLAIAVGDTVKRNPKDWRWEDQVSLAPLFYR
jgi:hypothetical protein